MRGRPGRAGDAPPGQLLTRAGTSATSTGPRQVTIAVDAMGGDRGPADVVTGALGAVGPGIRVVLAGRPAQLRPLLAAPGSAGGPLAPDTTDDQAVKPPEQEAMAASEVAVASADDSIAMDEGALASWRRPRYSIAVACQLVRRGQADAVVSAGSTGAIVTTARLRLRALPGIMRPGLAVVLPTRPGPTILVDAGAISDPKPEMLAQFAQLGVAYAQVAYGIPEPRVGLLTIGAEPGKGNKLSRRAFELLTAVPPHGGQPIHFAGNVEGTDLLTGKVDVVVTDGFTGNVALKSIEGAAGFAAGQFRDCLRGSAAARLGTVFQRRALSALRDRMDTDTYGGAALLGLEGTVVIAHGASTGRGVASACRLAADLARGEITEKIRERLGTPRSSHFLRRHTDHSSRQA